jgi:inner membrane protein YhjD
MRALKEIPVQAKLVVERARAKNGLIDVTLSTFKSFSLADGGTHTAALAYYAFFSIFPLLLFSTAALGFVTGGNASLRDEILQAGQQAVPLISDVLTEQTLSGIEERAGRIALLSVVIALYAGTGAIVALQHSLNRMAGLTDEPAWLKKRVKSLKFLALFGAGVVISIALGALAEAAARGALGGLGALIGWLFGRGAGLIVGVVLFAGAYKLLPAHDRSWRDVLPGALLAAVLFEILKAAGAWYLARGAQAREATFGAFALAAGLLVACYLIAQITLMAAHVNEVLNERRISRTRTGIMPKEA